MNYIVYAMIALTVMPILFGLLLGLLRGSRRALLRLVLVVISIALAFALTGVVTDAVVNLHIDALGGSVIEYVQNLLMEVAESLPESVVDYVIPLAQCLVQVVVFLLLFFVAWLLTWAIAYPLCKLFVKKGNKKRRLVGMAIGAVQGIIVAFVVCIVFTGLLVQANKVTTALVNLSDSLSEMETQNANAGNDVVAYDDAVEVDGNDDNTNANEGANNEQPANSEINDVLDKYLPMLDEYVNSPIGKMYNAVGAKPFDWITSVKVDDKKVTLSSQIDVISNIVTDIGKLAKEFYGLQNFDFSTLLEEGGVDNLKDLFDSLGNVINDLSDETKVIIDDLVAIFAGEAGLDLGDTKLTEVDFHKEGQILSDLYAYTQKEELTTQDANEIVETLADSDLVLGVLKNQNLNVTSNLSDEQLDAVSNKIQEMENSDSLTPEKIDALRQIFGLKNPPEQSELEEASAYVTYAYAA